ncbi:MAG TPA: OmpA family protein [Longimicrobiaceae bacterium]|nr:OmpA family protein [Longimicrobiaceae bacterium]
MYRSCAVLLTALAVLAAPAQAQFGGRLKRLKDRAKDRVEKTIGVQAEDAAPQAAAESAASSADDVAASTESSAAPGKGAWLNYDFVPGDHVLFADDFTGDNVGDFPRHLEFVEGNMEVAEYQGQRWLHTTGYGGQFDVVLPATLPERFTIEFDLIQSDGSWPQQFHIVMPDGFKPTYDDFICAPDRGGLTGPHAAVGEMPGADNRQVRVSCRVMMDGSYAKMYVNEKRVANVPNAKLGRSNRIRFSLYASERDPVMLGNLRIAAGGKDLYDALSEKGRVATQGIYFDSGSDRIRPESTPTLKQITAMLTAHPDLRLTIEGHTDNVGSAAANQALSERRAAAVAAYLAGQGISADRLESKGFGASKPAASNDTPEGRQQNRRVELVKR